MLVKKRSTVAGSSMLAISRTLAPIIVAGAGLAIASPAQAQSTCSPLLGLQYSVPAIRSSRALFRSRRSFPCSTSRMLSARSL